MTTDNRTNEPTEAQVEAAAKALYANKTGSERGFEHTLFRRTWLQSARIALVAAQGAAPQDSGKCGGCRDLGPHRNVPGCQYYEAPVLPSSALDEDALAEFDHWKARNDAGVAARTATILSQLFPDTEGDVGVKPAAVRKWLGFRAAEYREAVQS